MSFCSRCGAAVVVGSRFCNSCGNEVATPTQMCSYCGSASPFGVHTCRSCGAPFSASTSFGRGKSKTTSVLLAVFLAHWTWLNTYKRDAWKFWIGTGLLVVNIVLSLVSYRLRLDGNFSTATACSGWEVIIAVGLWVWAVVDVSVKNANWYRNFPNG